MNIISKSFLSKKKKKKKKDKYTALCDSSTQETVCNANCDANDGGNCNEDTCLLKCTSKYTYGFCSAHPEYSLPDSYDIHTDAYCPGDEKCTTCKKGYGPFGSEGNEYCLECKTSGTCDESTLLCDGYWCSSGNVCQDEYRWDSEAGFCLPGTYCSPTCNPFTPNCVSPNVQGCLSANTACCLVNYGEETTDCLPI